MRKKGKIFLHSSKGQHQRLGAAFVFQKGALFTCQTYPRDSKFLIPENLYREARRRVGTLYVRDLSFKRWGLVWHGCTNPSAHQNLQEDFQHANLIESDSLGEAKAYELVFGASHSQLLCCRPLSLKPMDYITQKSSFRFRTL